jgi:uncharacterized protein
MRNSILICGFCLGSLIQAANIDPRIPNAAMQGDRDGVSTLLKEKADVNAAQGDGMTALHWAAFHDDLELARMLIKAGADVKTTTRDGNLTPLSMACTNGSAAMIEELLKAGADPNSRFVRGTTPLMIAAESGSPDAVKVLLDHRADVNAREEAHGQTAAMFAAAANRADVLKVLAASGADLSITTRVEKLEEQRLDDNGNPLPAKGGDSTVNGGNTTMGGMTALLFAARQGALDSVRALIEAGADVNEICAGDHSSPLLIATANGHYQVGKYLVEHGANPNLANVDGLTPLYATIDMQYAPVSWAPNPLTVQEKVTHLELMKALLDHGANPDAKLLHKLWFRPTSHNQQWISTVGTTAFWRAAQATDVPAMKLLVEHGADPKVPSAAGTTALMVAAGLGFAGNFSQNAPDSWLAAVKYCLDLGLDINAADNQGYTTLAGAAYRGDNDLVKFLVTKGANLQVRNKLGWSITDMANGPSLRSSVPLAHPDTVALLQQLGAPPLTELNGETILGSGRRYRAAEARAAGPASKSPEDAQFQKWMKDVSAASGNLKTEAPAHAHADVAKDADKLQQTFAEVQAFFAKRNTPDAVSLAEAMSASAKELSAAAAAGNADGEDVALKKLSSGCASCHSVHREKLSEGGFKIK